MLLVALLTGCGNNERSSSTPVAETMAAADWSRRAEQLCEQNATRAERAVLRLRDEARAENLSREEFAARALETASRTSDPLLDRLEALPLPEGREEQARRFGALIREAQTLLGDSPRAIRDDDDQAAQKANNAILDVAVPSRALARELDIEECIPRGSQ